MSAAELTGGPPQVRQSPVTGSEAVGRGPHPQRTACLLLRACRAATRTVSICDDAPPLVESMEPESDVPRTTRSCPQLAIASYHPIARRSHPWRSITSPETTTRIACAAR